MNPAWRRRILALLLAGVIGCPSASIAQQAPPQGPAAKTATQKSAAAKRKPEAKTTPGDAPKLDAAAAQGEVEAGINALGQGKLDNAVASLSTALSAGSLPSAQTARALYYRGVAYRRQNKPAQAISDLTSALWIKSGLNDEQRADALQQRSGAYREAGLPDQADPPGARTNSAQKSDNSSAKTGSGAVAPSASSSTSDSGGFFATLFGGSSASSPPPTTTATQAAAAASAPAAHTASPRVAEASRLPIGFQEFPQPVAREVTASTPRASSQPQPVVSNASAAVSRSWDAVTEVKRAPAPAQPKSQVSAPPTQTAVVTGSIASPSVATATAPPAQRQRSAPAAVAPPSGVLQVQVAAVRSAQEAQGVAQRLQSQFARELGGRAPVVDQTTVGTLGTLYRVQVGPFASVRDTEALCAKLKGEGMDCRIVSQ